MSAAAPPAVFPAPRPEDHPDPGPRRPLRLAVVGLGVISRFYLDAIAASPHTELAAVCDRDPAALAPWQGRTPCHPDHRALLADAEALALDGVVVTVPNDAHAPVCRDLLAAGLPVCVEKPLALTSADADELTALAAARRVPLFTAFHRRYNSHVRLLAARLRRNLSGARQVTVRYFERIEDHVGQDRWYLDPARCGGGCVADNGPNAVDLVRLLLGEVELTAAEIARDDAGVDRSAVLSLRSTDGVPATVELDWSYGDGECKDVRVELADGGELYADMLTGFTGFKESLAHEYAAIVADFAALLAGPGPTAEAARAAGAGGPAALALVEAAYRSAAAPAAGAEAVR